jgi:hypothetical protein
MDMLPITPSLAGLERRPLLRAASALLMPAEDEDRQEGLDLLALLAGLKRVCLLGRGRRVSDAVRRVAAMAALPIVEGVAWDPVGDLPRWYRDATARHRAKHPVTYLCADETTRAEVAALCAKGRVSADEEAALLSYPVCCVAQHHRRALLWESMIVALAADDIPRMARMIEAGIEPRPATHDDWQRYRALIAIAPAPYTSVNMCEACAADEESPAQAMSRRYRALAEAVEG